MDKYALQGTYINRAYQLSVQLDVQSSKYGTVKYYAGIIYNWTKKKFNELGLGLPENICTISRSRPGHSVDTIYDISQGYFCLNAEHPDTSIPGRTWTIEAEIILENNVPRFGIRLSYSTPKNLNADKAEFSIPGFVTTIYKKRGMIDVFPLQEKAFTINSEDDLYSIFDFIHAKNRSLPVIMITEKTSDNDINSQYCAGYLVDGNRLAQTTYLIAHIVVLPAKYEEKWTELSGKNWGVFGGAVRTYYPNADFSTDDYYSHPLALANKILASSITYQGKEYISGEAFEKILVQKLKDYNTNYRYDWGAVGHKFYFAANKERLSKRENKIHDVETLQESYDEQIKQYESKIAIQADDYDTLWLEKESIEKELAAERDVIRRQNSLIDSLRYQLYGNDKNKIEIPIYDTYDKLSEWVKEFFPGKIRILGRAEQSLKEAEFEDIQLVYKSLMLLGIDYYDMRMGYIGRSEFDDKCRTLGIDEAESIADARAGELGDTYFVSYAGKRVKIDRHLRKGKKTRDPKRCMRIYFFWDDDESQVVLCSLPQHLEIRTS